MKSRFLSALFSVFAFWVGASASEVDPAPWNWQVRRVPAQTAAEEWIQAVVPGTVAVSYRDAGLLEDIRFDDNLTRIDDDWYVSDFEYRAEFPKPEVSKGERVVLNFDGISWKADVTLNGSHIGRIEGSFIRSRFDITDILKETNELRILIHHQDHPGAVKIPLLDKTVPNGGVLGADNPCFHAAIGWDWLPTVPGRNIGIWNDVYLTSAPQGVVIEDAFFDTFLGEPQSNPLYAEIRPTVSFNNFSDSHSEGELTVRFGEKTIKKSLTVPAGRNDISLESFILDNPSLWWPNGYGEPFLYDVTVIWTPKSGAPKSVLPDAASKVLKCGVRQMRYTLEHSALQIWINGRRFIPKGGNWGFSEINLQFGAREYDIAMRYHKLMNFNMIRNWVGQVGDDELYEAADKWGIMVWQDFWLANPYDGPDPDNHAMFLENASDMLHRVRPHACVALYCARNEGTAPRKLELKINRLVADLCTGSLYIPNSSEYSVSGQGPYWNVAPADYFRNISNAADIPVGDNKFHSERGAPNIPSYESLCRMFRPEHRWPQNDVWGMHNFTLKGAQRCSALNKMVSDGLGEPSSLKEFSDRAQYVDFNTYRALFESRSSHRNGLLIWMSHPAWPCLVFQTYDYWFDVNAGVYGAKRGAAPLRIQWNPALGCIEVVNDCAGNLLGLEAEVSVLDLSGKTLSSQSSRLDAFDDSTVRVCDFKAPEGQEVYYLQLSLKKGAEVLAENFYWEGATQGNWQAIPKAPSKALKVKVNSGAESVYVSVTNTSDVVLPVVRLNLLGKPKDSKEIRQILPAFYEDNYFPLLPGQTRTVRIDWIASEHQGETITVDAEPLR